jgi:hypothetical protein
MIHTQPDKVVYDIHILMDIPYFFVYFWQGNFKSLRRKLCIYVVISS